MQINNSIVLSILLGITLVSCKNEEVKVNTIFPLQEKNHASYNLTQLCDSVIFASKYFNENALFPYPSKVILRNMEFFTLASLPISSTTVKHINLKNKKISSIGTIGKGPKEYGNCFDFDIAPNGQLAIYDRVKKRLLLHKPDFSIDKIIQIPFYVLQIAFVNNEELFALCDEHDNPRIIGFSIHTGERFFTKYLFEEAQDFEVPKVFSQYNNKLLFLRPGSDTIYKYSNHIHSPFLHLNFENNSLDKKFLAINDFYERSAYFERNNLCIITHIFHDQNYHIIKYLIGTEMRCLLLKDGKVVLSTSTFTHSDKNIGLPIELHNGTIMFYDDNGQYILGHLK